MITKTRGGNRLRFRTPILTAAVTALLWLGMHAAAPPPESGTAPEQVPAPLLAAVRPGPLMPEGHYTISLWHNGTWQAAGRLGADRYDRLQLLVLRDLPASGPVRLRIEQAGGGAAHLDSILLNGQAPVEALGAPLKKLARQDNDIDEVSGHAIEVAFDPPGAAPRSAAILSLGGRIEPKVIGTEPLQFPARNTLQPVTPESAFYSYVLGSRQGALTLDGELAAERLGKPLFQEWVPNTSGHPQAFTYGWALNDDRNLYVAVDFASDNTWDGDLDYVKVYANLPGGVREFKASEPERRWGRPGFTYTERAAYQHKVYEFAIPLEELGVTPGQASRAKLQLAFAAYGTVSTGVRQPRVAYDSERNCFFSTYNEASGSNYSVKGLFFSEAGTAIGSASALKANLATTNEFAADLAFDPTTQNYFALWLDNNGSWDEVHGRIVNGDGSGTGTVAMVSSFPSTQSYRPAIAANSTDGGFLVTYTSQTGPDENLYAQRISAGGALAGSTIDIDIGSPATQRVSAVAYDSANNRYLVVWHDDGAGEIQGMRVSASGVPGTEFTIRSTSVAPIRISLAYNETNGTFVVVWDESVSIFSQRLDATGAASGPQVTVGGGGAFNVYSPAIAHDPVSGGYLVAWQDNRNTEYDIYGQVLDEDGAKVGSNQKLAASSGVEQEFPSLAVNSLTGGVMLVYDSWPTSGTVRDFGSTFIGSLTQGAGRSLPPGAGYALLALAGLAALLWLAKRRVPRLRPAYAVVALALVVSLLVVGGIVACTSSGGGGGKEEPPVTCPLT